MFTLQMCGYFVSISSNICKVYVNNGPALSNTCALYLRAFCWNHDLFTQFIRGAAKGYLVFICMFLWVFCKFRY